MMYVFALHFMRNKYIIKLFDHTPITGMQLDTPDGSCELCDPFCYSIKRLVPRWSSTRFIARYLVAAASTVNCVRGVSITASAVMKFATLMRR